MFLMLFQDDASMIETRDRKSTRIAVLLAMTITIIITTKIRTMYIISVQSVCNCTMHFFFLSSLSLLFHFLIEFIAKTEFYNYIYMYFFFLLFRRVHFSHVPLFSISSLCISFVYSKSIKRLLLKAAPQIEK